jgi:predicted secreted protein
MSVGAVVAIYFVVWWITLFAVLPWGVRAQGDAVDRVPGTDPGAPVRPGLGRKMLATTVLAAVVTGGLVYLLTSGAVTLDDLPMPFETKGD